MTLATQESENLIVTADVFELFDLKVDLKPNLNVELDVVELFQIDAGIQDNI